MLRNSLPKSQSRQFSILFPVSTKLVRHCYWSYYAFLILVFLSRSNMAERMTQNQYPLFSSGLELASLVASSDVLHRSWAAISDLDRELTPNELPFYLKWKIKQESSCTIIAFATSPTCTKHHLREGRDLVSSANFPLFEFLCSQGNSSFSIHKAAITLFASFYNDLSELKTQLGNCNRLIITGRSLGGSIASLFTLWLLECINPTATKRPLCITFGSPLIGDKGFQQALLDRPTWNSSFLHVAASQDPVPRFFVSPHNPLAMDTAAQTNVYKPFGTFLLCSEFGCTCLDNPEAISEILAAMGLEIAINGLPNEELLIVDYESIEGHLKSVAISKGISELGESFVRSLRAGIVLQLQAIGLNQTQQQQNSDINTLITIMEKWEETCKLNKRKFSNRSKKLNDMKVNMAYLEWYKKDSKTKNIGYYDTYKNNRRQSDRAVIKFKKFLTNYWKEEIAEAERNPQKEGSSLLIRWLYGGTNYRRMVEPLDIAEYYNEKGLKDYKTNGRSRHYIQLEKWLEEAGKPAGAGSPNNSKKQNISASLTEDSCFWANVEEALISCKLLKSGDSSTAEKEFSRDDLIKFEQYVMEQINNYAVSPEIFLEGSSFMQWWKEYKEITGPSHNSRLAEFMKNRYYRQYDSGCYEPT